MRTLGELDILLKQYEIVQGHQKDSNMKIFNTWIGFGAIITAAGIIIASGNSALIQIVPFAFIFWVYLLGTQSYDNYYRAIFLSYLENEINRRSESKMPLLIYDSFASAKMWKFSLKGEWGIPGSMLWLIPTYTACLIVYIGVCVIALQHSQSGKWYLVLAYSIPVMIVLLVGMFLVPRQLKAFANALRTRSISDTETIID
jgi:hypothetical protein